MGPGRLPGMQVPGAGLRHVPLSASMGPGRLPGMQVNASASNDDAVYVLQWGPGDCPGCRDASGMATPSIEFMGLQWGPGDCPGCRMSDTGHYVDQQKELQWGPGDCPGCRLLP